MSKRSAAGLAVVVLAGTVSSTILIPALRPLFATLHPGQDGAMHAFMSLNLLGAILGAPLLGALSDRRGGRRSLLVGLMVADALLLAACAWPLPLPLVLVLRTLQGACNLGAVAMLFGFLGRGAHPGRELALGGSAVVTGIALGPPLGVALLPLHPGAPLLVGAAVELAAALACQRILPACAGPRASGASPRALLRQAPLLRWPIAWVAAERFTVGAFVVTFSLHAHRELGLTDARTGAFFSVFLASFAAATFVFGRWRGRLDREALIAGGLALYGLCFLFLAEASIGALWLLFALAGTAAAAVYAPSLCLTAVLAPPTMRATAMGVLNAAGALGMLAGTASAGIASAALRASAVPEADARALVFKLAGIAPLAMLLLGARALRRLRVAAPPEPRAAPPGVEVTA